MWCALGVLKKIKKIKTCDDVISFVFLRISFVFSGVKAGVSPIKLEVWFFWYIPQPNVMGKCTEPIKLVFWTPLMNMVENFPKYIWNVWKPKWWINWLTWKQHGTNTKCSKDENLLHRQQQKHWQQPEQERKTIWKRFYVFKNL